MTELQRAVILAADLSVAGCRNQVWIIARGCSGTYFVMTVSAPEPHPEPPETPPNRS